MNSTTTEMVEARQGREHRLRAGVEVGTASVRRIASRNSLADRMALRLGMALVIWSRQHAARQDVRLDQRVVATARRAETEDRRARQFSSDRRDLVALPRR